ncbi:MAG: tetratricopeptide repeat protein [Alphaproteobacteria bacterium]|nr:tetratricopeptide repeat protein [Alphaproteobacteria bacterium]
MPKKSMKKSTRRVVKKPAAPKKIAATAAVKQIAKPVAMPIAGAKPAHRARFTLYVYWVIILFFVSATFYILGRGHNILVKHESRGAEIEMVQQAQSASAELLEMGKNKLLGGDFPGAVIDMTAAIEVDSNNALAYNYRGEAYMAEANYAAASSDLDYAIVLDPESSLAFYDRALLNIQLGNLDAAMFDLNSALEVFGRRPVEVLAARDIYSKRAQLNLWLKNWEQAISDYSVALNQSGSDPSDEDFAGRADAYTALGMYNEAINDYMSAITTISNTIKNNEDAATRINMSRRAMSYFEKNAALHVQIGDLVSARADLEAANTLAAALNDEDTQLRIQGLLESMF